MSPRFLFLILTLFWGGSYIAIYYTLKVYPPIFSAAMRVGFGTLFLLMFNIHRLRKIFETPRDIILKCAFAGILSMGIGWGLLFWSELHVQPAVAALLNAATPVITAFLLPLFQKGERTHASQWVGLCLGIVGVTFIFAPHLDLEHERSTFAGMLAVLGLTLCFGITTAFLRPLTTRMFGAALFFWQGLPAFFILLLVSFFAEDWPTWQQVMQQPQASLAVGYLALCSTAIGFWIWLTLIKTIGSVATSTVTYCLPLVSILLDLLYLHRLPPWSSLLGGGVLITGVVITQYQSLRKLRTSKTSLTAPV